MTEIEEKLKPLRAILETIRERADCALKQLQDAQDERSNAMAMQRFPLGKTFHSTRSERSGGKMSEMQRHFV